MSRAAGSPDLRHVWYASARRLAWRVNLCAVLDVFTPAAVVASLLASASLFVARRHGNDAGPVWATFAGLLAIALLAAVWRARRRFLASDQALLWLDGALQLRCRLVSAAAGVGEWPAAPRSMPAVFRVRRSRVLTPLAFAAALVAVGLVVPVSRPVSAEARPVDPPPAWREVDNWLRDLKQESLVAPEAVDAWEERLNRLRRQPESSWYGHGSLEAGDTLHQQVEASLRTLGDDLESAADSVELMQSVGGKSKSAAAADAGQKLERALKPMEAGPVSLHPELLSRLKAAAAAAKQGQTPSMSELNHLKRRLQEGSGFCKLKVGTGECRPGDPDCLYRVGRRRIRKDGGGPEGQGGNGDGPDGGGSAPLTLGPDAARTASKRMEGVSNEDLQHAALGDTIGLSSTTHKVDEGAYHGPTRGGPAAAGQGGETVWRDAWTPEEERVLQRYFK